MMVSLMSQLSELAAPAGALLKETGQSISVAESSCGGLISAALVAIPDASAYYEPLPSGVSGHCFRRLRGAGRPFHLRRLSHRNYAYLYQRAVRPGGCSGEIYAARHTRRCEQSPRPPAASRFRQPGLPVRRLRADLGRQMRSDCAFAGIRNHRHPHRAEPFRQGGVVAGGSAANDVTPTLRGRDWSGSPHFARAAFGG